MTDREKEVYELIKNRPTISQQELADILGISRSCTANHIRGLIKKGFIKGRKYILANNDYEIVVIGSCNIDIQGISKKNILVKDSNPGKIYLSHGGVGRNICENISKLTNNTSFITVLGDDEHSKNIYDELFKSNVDLSNSLIMNNKKMSIYLAILDEKHDMFVGVNDMDLIKNLNMEFLKSKIQKINLNKIAILDTNLPKDSVHFLLSNITESKIVVDLVSAAKANKVVGHLSKIHSLKANKLEAEILTGITLDSKENIIKAGEILLDYGVKYVFITLGEDGVYYTDGNKSGFIKNLETDVVDATGAGDAFTAGIAFSLLNDYDIEKCAKFAITMSYLNIQNLGTVYNKLNKDILFSTYKKLWEAK